MSARSIPSHNLFDDRMASSQVAGQIEEEHLNLRRSSKKSVGLPSMMRIATRLCDRLGLLHPIMSAPMAFASGGDLQELLVQPGGLGSSAVVMATETG